MLMKRSVKLLTAFCLTLPVWVYAQARTPVAATLRADPLNCRLSEYKPAPGLSASVISDTLTITWEGDRGARLRMRFEIVSGTPTIRELAIRPRGGQWRTLVTNVTPEFRVVSGLRRVTAQQLEPDSLAALGVPLTPDVLDAWKQQNTRADAWLAAAARSGRLTAEIIERIKWDAFWDAPLYVEGSGVRPPSHPTAIPPVDGLLGQPGLPRRPE
ncbi:MAG: hypothetical protein ACREEM_40715, partial [Blastocatellia bacterium]